MMYRILICSEGLAFLLVLAGVTAGGAGLSKPATTPSTTAASSQSSLRWDQRYLRDYHIYKLFLTHGFNVEGSRVMMSEPDAWLFARNAKKQKALKDDQREGNLKQLLAEYPNSDYAGDAALLLARAKFIYHQDADGAIKDLYKVSENYPESHWVAEDRAFLEWATIWDIKRADAAGTKWVPRTSWFGDESPKEHRGTAWEVLTYFSYLDEHPNLTADEALYWIGWIIVEGQVSDRYDEARRNFEKVIAKYRTQRRAQGDVTAAEQMTDPLLRDIARTEMKSYLLLLRLLEIQNKREEFVKACADFSEVFQGHSVVSEIEPWTKKTIANMAGTK